MRPSGLHINKPVIIGLFALAAVIFLAYWHFTRSTVPSAPEPPVASEGEDKPIQRESKMVDIKVEDKAIKVYVEQAIIDSEPDLDVLLLHGAKFSSKDWLDIKTMDHVANWGHRAVAIDLPGKGKSIDPLDDSLHGKFLDAFIKTMEMKKTVIIAPSASGSYALPYLFGGSSTTLDNVVGFIPIAPVGTQEFKAKYPESKLHTLIIYGVKDTTAAEAVSNLKLIPGHEVAEIEDAGHACYIDNPDVFHKQLFNFLKDLVG